jgi:hypothetical protein
MRTRISAGIVAGTTVSLAVLLSACGGSDPVPTLPSEQAHEHEVAPPAPGTAAMISSGVVDAMPATAPTDLGPGATPTPTITETITLAPTYTALVAGTINALPYWPVWWGTGQPVDGVNCLINSSNHRHALISIYKDGKRLGFPDGIGRVHAGCYHAYEMHVHDVTGIIHMESDVPKTFKLGQWFSLWQQPLSRDGTAGLAGPVRFYLIDKEKLTPYYGNPYDILMLPHREVLIVSGSALSVVPRYQWPLGI